MYRILLVDDESAPLADLQKELKQINSNWDVLIATGGKQAMDFFRHQKVDITISDLNMPVMNGVELLSLIRAECPGCMRIAIIDPKDIHQYQNIALAAHQFIAKPWSIRDVAAKIYQLHGLSNILHQEGVQKVVNQISRLPSQSSAYSQLIDELNKQESSLDKTARIISTDMSMTAKLLQLVNSAYFGLPREVHDVSQAIFYLGTDTIRDLVLSVQIFSYFEQDKLEAAGLGGLWDHSLMVAQLSRALAASITNDKSIITSAFTAGLLHDLGKLILGVVFKDFYSTRSLVGKDSIYWLGEEKRQFESSHADIGAYLLGLWGIPPAILIAVSNHHSIQGYLNRGFALSVSVYFANYFAYYFSNNPLMPAFQLEPAVEENAWVKTFFDVWKHQCEKIIYPAKVN